MSEGVASPREIVAHLLAAPRYSRILEALRKQFIEQGEPDVLVVPYTLVCAATLEARLNDELYFFARRTWGDESKSIADSYVSMSFRGKLNAIVSILTQDAFRMNQDHDVYKALASLISARNQVVHPKPVSRRYGDATEHVTPVGKVRFSRSMSDELDDLTLGASAAFSPLDYHRALERLDHWVFRRCPDRLSKVALVKRRGIAGR